eukprot:GHVP01068585.1.p1 GENE.GHVP01068585.1~~GHVP01068585.1.p1  ORF type:complete len:461 (+),score=62.68 GHVP01068585.1:8-1390(+)
MEIGSKLLEKAIPAAIQAQQLDEQWNVPANENPLTDELHFDLRRSDRSSSLKKYRFEIGIGVCVTVVACLLGYKIKTDSDLAAAKLLSEKKSASDLAAAKLLSESAKRRNMDYYQDELDTVQRKELERLQRERMTEFQERALDVEYQFLVGSNVNTSPNATALSSFDVDASGRKLFEDGAELSHLLCKSRKPDNLHFAHGLTSTLYNRSRALLIEGYDLLKIDSSLPYDCVAAKQNVHISENCSYGLKGKPKTIPELMSALTSIQWIATEMRKVNSQFIHVRNTNLISEIPAGKKKEAMNMLLGDCWTEAKRFTNSEVVLMGYGAEFNSIGLKNYPVRELLDCNFRPERYSVPTYTERRYTPSYTERSYSVPRYTERSYSVPRYSVTKYNVTKPCHQSNESSSAVTGFVRDVAANVVAKTVVDGVSKLIAEDGSASRSHGHKHSHKKHSSHGHKHKHAKH